METRSRFRDLHELLNVAGQSDWEKRPVGCGRRLFGVATARRETRG